MRTGERSRRAALGFTYLAMLLAIAIGGAAAAAIGSRWSVTAQREREAELLFRGREIQRALARYAGSTPDGRPNAPLELAELLEDARQGPTRRHLRRLYTDPFTDRPDWRLIRRTGDGRIVGVASRSRRPALRVHDVTVEDTPPGRPPSVGDWRFVADLPAPAASSPASGPATRIDDDDDVTEAGRAR